MAVIVGTLLQQLIKYGKIEQWLVRQTHNLKVAGSNPALAIII